MRSKGGFRKRSNGNFVVPTTEEINKESKRIMTGQIAEILQKIEDVENGWLNIQLQQEKVLFRMSQLGLNEDGKEVNTPLVKETFNGAIKSIDFLKAEYNIDLHNYKELVGDFESNKRYLIGKGFTKEQIKDIQSLRFNKTGWLESETNKVLGEKVL